MALTHVQPKIAVAGAGSIGCYIGGRLLQAEQNVTFLARERIKLELQTHGLKLTALDEEVVEQAAESLSICTSPECLSDADLILVTVKSGATLDIAQDIQQHAPESAIVVSLQNGVSNADKLREVLCARTVVAGMVPFNVAHLGEGRFHQGMTGAIMVESGVPGLNEILLTSSLEIEQSNDMPSVMWGKLLLNLNNALNALSNLPLREQIENRDWRRLLADQMAETLSALDAANIQPKSALPLPVKWLPRLMRLPTPIFRIIAARMTDIDPLARSSMWEDLQRGRMTEIDELQGAVIELAAKHGLDAPICKRVTHLVKQAERAQSGSPECSVSSIRSEA